MATNITTSIRRKEIDLLDQKAKAKGITKCAYVRDLIRNDLNGPGEFSIKGIGDKINV